MLGYFNKINISFISFIYFHDFFMSFWNKLNNMLQTRWATCFKQVEQHASNKLSNMLQTSWETCFKQVEQHASNKLSNMLQTSWATIFTQVEQHDSHKLSNMLQTSWATCFKQVEQHASNNLKANYIGHFHEKNAVKNVILWKHSIKAYFLCPILLQSIKLGGCWPCQ